MQTRNLIVALRRVTLIGARGTCTDRVGCVNLDSVLYCTVPVMFVPVMSRTGDQHPDKCEQKVKHGLIETTPTIFFKKQCLKLPYAN